MTDSTTARPAPLPVSPPAPRPYAPPALALFGEVGALTAGPDGDKTLDGLVGDDGGFRLADEPTS